MDYLGSGLVFGGVAFGGYVLRKYFTGPVHKNLINGKQIAERIRQELKEEVAGLKNKPCLAVVLVGSRKDSATYVRMKKRACREAGITSIEKKFKKSITTDELIQEVRKLNEDEECDGILVQLPLPDHVNQEAVLNEIGLEKDVDGFHPLNIGKLCMKNRTPTANPCTPLGCVKLLEEMKVEISGKRAVVIGRSNIVGIPVAMMLLQRNATVTIVHSRTKDTDKIVKQADIIIAACGRAKMVKKEWVKRGAVIVDVGINSEPTWFRRRGYQLVGDVDFENVAGEAGLITPVPGGVGPMTIAMLLKNCVQLHKQRRGVEEEVEGEGEVEKKE